MSFIVCTSNFHADNTAESSIGSYRNQDVLIWYSVPNSASARGSGIELDTRILKSAANGATCVLKLMPLTSSGHDENKEE